MIEYIAAVLLIVLTAVVFLFFKKEDKSEEKSQRDTSQQGRTNKTDKKEEIKPTSSSDIKKVPEEKIVDPKSILLNSFREGKDLTHPFITRDGKTVLYHDDKRIYLCFINNLSEKNPKFISKTIEQDVICDASYSQDKRLVAVGLKNSKNLIFYDLKEEGGKLKLNKLEKVIPTTRKFEIKNVTISKDGNYVATTGTDQDTLIQIYDVKTGNNLGNIDTNEIKNVEMKMTPDDKCLTVSTFMREIAVIEYKKTEKFNKEAGGYEVNMKVQRNRSISGIKLPIDSYDFSNDDKFFVVSCEDKKIKIFQNYGHIEESKIITEFTAKEMPNPEGDRVTLFVSSVNLGKLNGFVSLSINRDIYVYDCEGTLIKLIKDAHDSKINLLKLVSDETSEGGRPLLISASRDARFHVWKI